MLRTAQRCFGCGSDISYPHEKGKKKTIELKIVHSVIICTHCNSSKEDSEMVFFCCTDCLGKWIFVKYGDGGLKDQKALMRQSANMPSHEEIDKYAKAAAEKTQSTTIDKDGTLRTQSGMIKFD